MQMEEKACLRFHRTQHRRRGWSSPGVGRHGVGEWVAVLGGRVGDHVEDHGGAAEVGDLVGGDGGEDCFGVHVAEDDVGAGH